MTHKTIECLERPRRIGAQFNGKNIAPDEYLPAPGNHTYDGKRDIHKHYDPNDYQKVIQDYEKVEQMKRQLKNEQLQKDLIEQSKKTAEEKAAERVAPAAEESSDSEEEGEDDKKKKAEDELKGYTESSSMAGELGGIELHSSGVMGCVEERDVYFTGCSYVFAPLFCCWLQEPSLTRKTDRLSEICVSVRTRPNIY